MPDGPSIAVLSGGISLEREVSLRSGSRVADALSDRGHQVTRLDVDGELVRTLDAGGFDVAFLALHGSAGEDGTIQSLLELIGLPYTGPDVLASSLAWNKPIAQGLFARAGLAVPARVTLSQQAFREMGATAAVDRIATELSLPLVVKPASGGSSLGLTIVEDASRLPQAIVGAFSYADAVLIEAFIAGTEVAVTVLDGQALPAVEIQPKDGAYDFAARYTAGATEFFVPARLDDLASRSVRPHRGHGDGSHRRPSHLPCGPHRRCERHPLAPGARHVSRPHGDLAGPARRGRRGTRLRGAVRAAGRARAA
jgi:D-alanine-D-alanine ligase